MMEGLNTQPPPPPQRSNTEDLKPKQEASSFVLALRGILALYKLNINSRQEDISALDQKVRDDFISTISGLIKERGINYVSEENKKMVREVKKMVGNTLGTLIEEIAFGDNTKNETMDEIIEKEATRLSVEIDENASGIVKEKISTDEKTKKLEAFVENKIKSATRDTKWNPKNIGELLNKIMDFVRTPWGGSTIKSLIFKIGKKIVKERENDFIEHGI